MLIDFREIPKANTGNGDQDTFELFARDFLSVYGYEVVVEPSRGADGGQDIKIKETRHGIGGKTEVYWLVSCKHYAHSKKFKSVSHKDEEDPSGRVSAKDCIGFIGFYSTLPSSGLTNMLEGLKNRPGSSFDYKIFDRAKIESLIIGYKDRENLFIRYFPESFKKWKEINYYNEPVKLFRFYIENKYKSLSAVFEAMFGSIENMIKPLREKKAIEDLFLESNIKIVTDERVHKFLFEDREKDENTSSFLLKLAKLIEEENIEILTEQHKQNTQLNKKTKSANTKDYIRYITLSFHTSEAIVLTKNSLIVTKTAKFKLSEMFKDLKSMLT
jgi:hypothetical protein